MCAVCACCGCEHIFVGKVNSLDVSDIVFYHSGVCARFSLVQDPTIVLGKAVTRLQGAFVSLYVM